MSKRKRFSDVVATAVEAALSAHSDGGMHSTGEQLTNDEWFAMYHAQCTATDGLAKKAAAKSDQTLLARINELEQLVAQLNNRIIELNTAQQERELHRRSGT